MIKKCEICGDEFDDFKKWNKRVCKKEKCLRTFNKFNKTPNCKCVICGRDFYIKPSRLKVEGKTCSLECNKIHRSIKMTGEGNHQFGLKGELNSSWNGGYMISHGYRHLYMPNHPFSCYNYIREHRIIAEKYLLNDKNSIVIDGKAYLSPEYDVHHKDGNKLNNNVENLMILTKGEHTKIHNLTNHQERDGLTGRFIKKRN